MSGTSSRETRKPASGIVTKQCEDCGTVGIHRPNAKKCDICGGMLIRVCVHATPSKPARGR